VTDEFDIVVAGAGLSGGLPAAAYLQKAGARVALVERGIEAGRNYLSYDLLPGVRFDHSPVNFSGLSPVVGDLDLAAFGYVLRPVDIVYSTLDRVGATATVHGDLERTIAALAQHSGADADAFRSLAEALAGAAPDLLRLLFYRPHPDAAALDEAIERSADVVGIPRYTLEQLDAPDLVERLFESDFVRRTVMALPALNLFGDLLVPRQGALTWLWSLLLRAAVAPSGNGSLAKALERAFVAAGGTLLRGAEVTGLEVSGGRCVGVTLERDGVPDRVDARQAVISNLGGPLTGRLLAAARASLHGEEQHAFVRRLDEWETRSRVIAVQDLVARRPIRWPDGGRDVERAPRVYLLWDSFARCREWLERCRTDDEDVFLDDIEVTQFGAVYGSPGDLHPVRVRFGTGPYLDGDWDQRRRSFGERMHEVLASYDPTFRETVVFEHLATPLDLWRSNPASAHGNPVGGDVSADQWIEERLPYRTPIDGLYLSNGVWPPGLSLMAAGYNAAGVVAEDLGIRDRAWWCHAPGSAMPRPRASVAGSRA
jgi:phytoene dehydrogenase-like protein